MPAQSRQTLPSPQQPGLIVAVESEHRIDGVQGSLIAVRAEFGLGQVSQNFKAGRHRPRREPEWRKGISRPAEADTRDTKEEEPFSPSRFKRHGLLEPRQRASQITGTREKSSDIAGQRCGTGTAVPSTMKESKCSTEITTLRQNARSQSRDSVI